MFARHLASAANTKTTEKMKAFKAKRRTTITNENAIVVGAWNFML